jgi:hypothetical protein
MIAEAQVSNLDHAWIIVTMLGIAGMMILSMAGLIKLMIIRRHDTLDETIKEGFADVHKESAAIKNELHEVDKRLVVIEAEHSILRQNGYTHCRHDDETIGGD